MLWREVPASFFWFVGRFHNREPVLPARDFDFFFDIAYSSKICAFLKGLWKGSKGKILIQVEQIRNVTFPNHFQVLTKFLKLHPKLILSLPPSRHVLIYSLNHHDHGHAASASKHVTTDRSLNGPGGVAKPSRRFDSLLVDCFVCSFLEIFHSWIVAIVSKWVSAHADELAIRQF